MAHNGGAPRRRRVGVYDRPRSADVNWVRWAVWLIALLVAVYVLYRMFGRAILHG